MSAFARHSSESWNPALSVFAGHQRLDSSFRWNDGKEVTA
jgi:hypothetical protein